MDISNQIELLKLNRQKEIRNIQDKYEELIFQLQAGCDHEFGEFEYYGEDFSGNQIDIRTCYVCGLIQKRNLDIDNASQNG